MTKKEFKRLTKINRAVSRLRRMVLRNIRIGNRKEHLKLHYKYVVRRTELETELNKIYN